MQVSLCLLLMNMNERIANVFVDFESAKHGKIDSRLICRATHKMMLGQKVFCPGKIE